MFRIIRYFVIELFATLYRRVY